MPRRMKSDAVRRHWRDVLDYVRGGGTVVVQHYNRPVASITPYHEHTMTDPTTITLPFDREDNDFSDPSYLDHLVSAWIDKARDAGLGEDKMRLWSVEVDRPQDEIAYVGPADGPRYALEVKPSDHTDSMSEWMVRCVERD